VKLSTRSRYAIMAMVDMAVNSINSSETKPMPLSEIAMRQELPIPYMEQLFLKLRKSGIINSSRGSNGGYVISRPPEDISIMDIVISVDRPIKTTRCNGASGCKSNGSICLTHDLWEGLELTIKKYLTDISLKDVCEKNIIKEIAA
jgi:Rrf2 family iron-sulfur cluster assembly transcriptional regulator